MFTKQISVFVENHHGRLADFTKLLSLHGIDMLALTVADTANFGIIRAVVSDPDRAAALLKQEGYSVSVTDVLAVAVPDHPGGLSQVLEWLQQTKINIEYLYSLVRPYGTQAVIILRVDDLQAALTTLSAHHVQTVTQFE